LKFGWNIRPDPTALEPLQKDFKLLKFLILRVILQLYKLYHKEALFETLEKCRIEGVTGRSSALVHGEARAIRTRDRGGAPALHKS